VKTCKYYSKKGRLDGEESGQKSSKWI